MIRAHDRIGEVMTIGAEGKGKLRLAEMINHITPLDRHAAEHSIFVRRTHAKEARAVGRIRERASAFSGSNTGAPGSFRTSPGSATPAGLV